MKRTEKGLWIAPTGVSLLKMRARHKTVTLPNGERAKVTIDDSGTVKQVWRDEQLDGYVTPGVIKGLRLPAAAFARAGRRAGPASIRSTARMGRPMT
jgi:hypothetical protein